MEKHEKPGEGRNNNTAARSPQHRDYILFARIFVEIAQPLCSGTYLVGLETVPTRTRWHPMTSLKSSILSEYCWWASLAIVNVIVAGRWHGSRGHEHGMATPLRVWATLLAGYTKFLF